MNMIPRTNDVILRSNSHHVSYLIDTIDYGRDTTAIVFCERVFFILNGDHTTELLNKDAYQAFLYFCLKVGESNFRSEHKMVAGIEKDIFSLAETIIDLFGKVSVDKLKRSIENE